jgi:hypothetical protein
MVSCVGIDKAGSRGTVWPSPAGCSWELCPVFTSRAEARKIALTSVGDKPGWTCLSTAHTPATCGEAARVPLMTDQPSSGAVSSALG